MISFFRKIRQNLLSQHRVTRYLAYAIGEIFLVVIGILIALQVNNWNENRKQEALINSYLRSISEDLQMDTTAIGIIQKNLQGEINNNSKIFHDKAYQELPLDSIVLLISSFFNVERIVDQTYQKIKNTGLANNLGSESLNNTINNYYSRERELFDTFMEYDKLRSTRDGDFWFLTDEYEINPPYSGENISDLVFAEDEAIRKQALIKKIESNRGRNTIRNNIVRKNLGLRLLKEMKEKSISLLELINEELTKNEPA